MRDITELLKETVSYYESLKAICMSEMQHLPTGRLSVSHRAGRTYYSKWKDGQKTYLPEGDKEIEQLKLRHFFEHYVRQLDANTKRLCRALRGIKSIDPALVSSGFSDAYRDIPDTCFEKLGFLPPTEAQSSRSEIDYHNDALIHRSACGIMMRSKSEVAIANIYTSRMQTFQYEKKLVFPTGECVYPDFTLRNKDGTGLIFHEHCGMMSDAGYRRQFYAKLDKYIKYDYIPFRDVFFTFDESDGSIDLDSISRIISFYFD